MTHERGPAAKYTLVRALLAALTLVAAAFPVLFAIRTAAAAWLVFPPPLLNPIPPTSDLAQIKRASALAPGDAMYRFFVAHVLQQELRKKWLAREAPALTYQAAAACEDALRLLPTNPYFHRLAGSVALDRAMHHETPVGEVQTIARQAVAFMKNALDLSPTSPMLHQQVGLELLRARDLIHEDGEELALTTLRRAAALDPSYLPATLQNVMARFGPESAWVALERVTPEIAEARLTLARFLESRAAEQTVVSLEQAAALRVRAVDEYRRALDLSDLDLEYVNHWAAAHRRMLSHDPAAFLSAARELAARHPRRPEAWLTVANAAASSGQIAEAMGAGSQAVGLASEAGDPALLARALRWQADWLFSQRAHEQALQACQQLASLLPEDPYPLTQAGRCLDALDRKEEALEAFIRAVEVAPRSRPSREALARAYLARHEYLKAIAQWQAILAGDPNAVGPRVSIARAYVALGILERASQYYVEALEHQPDNATIRREADEIVRRLGVIR